jgi:hypothetical protein
MMVRGINIAHKGLVPSRLVKHITVVEKMPILGTHEVYNQLLDFRLLRKSKGFSSGSFLFANLVLI